MLPLDEVLDHHYDIHKYEFIVDDFKLRMDNSFSISQLDTLHFYWLREFPLLYFPIPLTTLVPSAPECLSRFDSEKSLTFSSTFVLLAVFITESKWEQT